MVKKIGLFLFTLLGVFIITLGTSHAQNNQTVETEVGDAGDGGDGGDGGGGGNDNLGPGEFEIPFRCNLNYWSWTYAGHSPYSLDINRGGGDDDRGDPVLASADGTVFDRITSHGQIVLRHEDNYYTLYAHMQNITVSEGDRVRLGQKIGEIGDYGAPGQYHLHVNHSKGSPYVYANRIKVCYKRYGCNPVSIANNDATRWGTDYNKNCN